MTAPLAAIVLAQQKDGGFQEFGKDPLLTAACAALIVVCIVWVVLSRRISHNLDEAALRKEMKVKDVQAPKDIWKAPPE
jgi:hypothetical protein